jgi:Protein of unknown function (DUF4236)
MTGHLRIWRRFRILPGVTANVSKRGLSSFSFGRRGFHLTLGRKGRRITVGVPASGIFYTIYEPYDQTPRGELEPSEKRSRFWVWFVLVALIGIGALLAACGTSSTWTRPEMTQAEYDMDKARCEMKAEEGILIPGLPQHWMAQCMKASGYTRNPE